MYLIIGLGNPGSEYKNTRHNLGWLVLDALAKTWKPSKKFKAELAELAELAGLTDKAKVILAKPRTFMNDSGASVRLLSQFYKITPDHLLVVHDDLDLPLGTLKISTNSGAAGHHGVESIIEALGTKNFTRLRLGIGPRPAKIPGDKFVLQRFSKEDGAITKGVVKKSIAIIREWGGKSTGGARAGTPLARISA